MLLGNLCEVAMKPELCCYETCVRLLGNLSYVARKPV